MSFQAYLDNIQAKTGKGPSDFRRLADEKGFMSGGKLRTDIKAGQVTAWLKEEYELGHGHAMAIVALLKGTKKEGDA
ncbi:hypothetical protein OJF2_07880 [Aquisphaera giovannonii]|uniref:DUF4287 domain-containing protein n=1 Tax=Aquisphaera giovannonii TaxID=406548 RepID=A0A5B9VVQ7_9BACT|nr:DUF4287 domain-containing protein [Aquisphaera giovannonii]QEH32318.1 hypothetical protein OJF2_07880 [Aquisphaera giovannonii]